MSRNKENIPINLPQYQNGPALLSKHVPSDEFFTDSLLDATRLSSRIPTPSPQKPSLTKSRRARTNRTSRNTHQPSHRSSNSENLTSKSRDKSKQPSTPLRENGSGPSRLRTHSLTTPPGTDELPLASPYTSISSPPPQDLTDSYRQIEDDEDLAQTERELSSDDSDFSQFEDARPPRRTHKSHSESPAKLLPSQLVTSRASTPTRSINSVNRGKGVNDRSEALSEASGLSFLKEMTDQHLAAKLTPHISQSAKDKARLRHAWDQPKPIAFSKADPFNRFATREESSIPVPRGVVFSKASKPLPNAIRDGNPQQSQDVRPPSQQSGTSSQRTSNDTWQNSERQHNPLPTNNRIHRDFQFSTNHGFGRPALTEKNLEQQNRGSPNTNHILRPSNSVPSIRSDPTADNAKVLGNGLHLSNGYPSQLPQLRRSTQFERKPIIEEQSEIDWAAAAADVPIPSVENSLQSGETDATPVSISRHYTPEKSRRWENDFTGQSFQVSESPPVRSMPVLQESTRVKEIEGIAKQAVTTNRLSQIRERNSQENLRSISRSPGPRSVSQSSETKPRIVTIEEEDSIRIGERVPDTPVVIYRSSSGSSSGNLPKLTLVDRPDMKRSQSHDHLQRLARAMSTTPRSSPASGNGLKDNHPSIKDTAKDQTDALLTLPKKEDAFVLPESNLVTAPTVAQTPRVVGAWTDTILPETVKTVKQAEKQSVYAQTPHVSAGGWVDTPAPIEQRRSGGSIPTIMEEVPEELTAGIGKDTASSDTVKIEVPPNVQVTISSQATEQPRSALASILDQQKNRLVSQDITTATREDTLALGNETIQSLQDLIDLDEKDLTTLSRLSALEDDTKPLGTDAAEAEVLERLGVKLDRLRSNINDAKRGISKLEHQVSQPVENTTITTTASEQPVSNTTTQPLPYRSLTLSLPKPLLYHTRKPNQLLPRLTHFGTICAMILTVLSWYILESTLCELYSRPEYTEFYVWPSEPEPEFPFVLPTMLSRWTRLNKLRISAGVLWIWNFIIGALRASWRVFAMAVGWSDGFVDEAPRMVVKSVVETATSVLRAAATAVENEMHMDYDEFL